MVAHCTPKNEPQSRTSRTLFRMGSACTRATAHHMCACAHAPSQLIPCKMSNVNVAQSCWNKQIAKTWGVNCDWFAWRCGWGFFCNYVQNVCKSADVQIFAHPYTCQMCARCEQEFVCNYEQKCTLWQVFHFRIIVLRSFWRIFPTLVFDADCWNSFLKTFDYLFFYFRIIVRLIQRISFCFDFTHFWKTVDAKSLISNFLQQCGCINQKCLGNSI